MAGVKKERKSTPSKNEGVTLADAGFLLVRLALGIVFFAHGAQKVLGLYGGHGIAATVAMFGHMGIPASLAYIAMFTEFLGGLGLIFGVLTRLSALGIFIDMVVAVLMVHLKNGFFMNWGSVPGQGEGYEFHILVMGICLLLLFAGPGRLAILRKT